MLYNVISHHALSLNNAQYSVKLANNYFESNSPIKKVHSACLAYAIISHVFVRLT